MKSVIIQVQLDEDVPYSSARFQSQTKSPTGGIMLVCMGKIPSERVNDRCGRGGSYPPKVQLLYLNIGYLFVLLDVNKLTFS